MYYETPACKINMQVGRAVGALLISPVFWVRRAVVHARALGPLFTLLMVTIPKKEFRGSFHFVVSS